MEKMEDNDEGDLQRSKSFCFDVENATDNLDAKSDAYDLGSAGSRTIKWKRLNSDKTHGIIRTYSNN